MKRRNFLKTVAGVFAAITTKLKAKPVESRGFAFDYVVNNDTDVLQPVSRSVYPELRSPVSDAHGGPITFAQMDRVMAKLKDDADKRAQYCFDASEAYFRGRLRKRGLY